jgi:hypothetical protein
MPIPQLATNMIMLPTQDAIEELALAIVQRLEITHMVEIQNMNDMHVQKLDVLQSQIVGLILKL